MFWIGVFTLMLAGSVNISLVCTNYVNKIRTKALSSHYTFARPNATDELPESFWDIRKICEPYRKFKSKHSTPYLKVLFKDRMYKQRKFSDLWCREVEGGEGSIDNLSTPDVEKIFELRCMKIAAEATEQPESRVQTNLSNK